MPARGDGKNEIMIDRDCSAAAVSFAGIRRRLAKRERELIFMAARLFSLHIFACREEVRQCGRNRGGVRFDLVKEGWSN